MLINIDLNGTLIYTEIIHLIIKFSVSEGLPLWNHGWPVDFHLDSNSLTLLKQTPEMADTVKRLIKCSNLEPQLHHLK